MEGGLLWLPVAASQDLCRATGPSKSHEAIVLSVEFPYRQSTATEVSLEGSQEGEKREKRGKCLWGVLCPLRVLSALWSKGDTFFAAIILDEIKAKQAFNSSPYGLWVWVVCTLPTTR